MAPRRRGGRRFPKGVSGNPKGRPPGKSISSYMRKIIEASTTYDGKTMSNAEAIARAAIKRAKEGDSIHINAVQNRLEGKVPDEVKLTQPDRLPGVDDNELSKKLKQKGKQEECGPS